MGVSPELLNRVCEAYGIAPDYTDIWGNRHVASARTKSALLAAMGVASGDDASLTSALQLHQRRAWQALLAPAQVTVCSERGLPVTVSVRDDRVHRRHAWQLVEENGRAHRGEFTPADWQASAHARVDGKSFSRYIVELPRLAPESLDPVK